VGVGGTPTFPALFREHFAQMTRLAHLLGADDAENVAQEAFVQLHQRWDSLADHTRVVGYLRTTVVNMARSRTRHLRVVRRTPQERPPDELSAEVRAVANLGETFGPLPPDKAVYLLGSTANVLRLYDAKGDLSRGWWAGRPADSYQVFVAEVPAGSPPVRFAVS
jgi:DNA-directed RNA polymerase specialized sigma24 family protein